MVTSDTTEPLRIGHLPTFYHTSHLLMANGGPTVPIPTEWTLFNTGPAMMAAFGEDRLDVGYIGLPPAMVGMSAGTPAVCIAGGHVEGTVFVGGPGATTLADRDGDLDATLQQFHGGRLGTPDRGSIHDVLLRHALDEAGLADAVQVENVAQADMIVERMAEGDLDGGAGTPALAVAADRYADADIVVPPDAIWPNNPSYGIVARSGAVTDRRDSCEAFLRAHEDATRLIRNEPRRAAALAAGVVHHVPDDFVLETYELAPKHCGALPPAYVEATMDFLPVLIRMGYLEGRLERPAVFDRTLLDTVHPESDHYADGIDLSPPRTSE